MDKPATAAEPAAPQTRTDRRSDAAQAFIHNWLSQHPVAVSAFTADDAVALVAAIDATK